MRSGSCAFLVNSVLVLKHLSTNLSNMRQKRAKAYRKLMHLYCMNFGFRQPYQVLGASHCIACVVCARADSHSLVDSQMCTESASQKTDVTKQLATVLQGSVKPSALRILILSSRLPLTYDVHTVLTQCSINVLYLAGPDAQPAVDLARTFERRRCNHREAVPEVECMRDVLGTRNKHRYVLAAQSIEIRRNAREVPATPIVHVKRGVMVLEPVSDATAKAKEEVSWTCCLLCYLPSCH